MNLLLTDAGLTLEKAVDVAQAFESASQETRLLRETVGDGLQEASLSPVQDCVYCETGSNKWFISGENSHQTEELMNVTGEEFIDTVLRIAS